MSDVNVWNNGWAWRASLETSGDPEKDRRRARRAIVREIAIREQKAAETWPEAVRRVSETLGRIVKEEPQEGDELVVYRENI